MILHDDGLAPWQRAFRAGADRPPPPHLAELAARARPIDGDTLEAVEAVALSVAPTLRAGGWPTADSAKECAELYAARRASALIGTAHALFGAELARVGRARGEAPGDDPVERAMNEAMQTMEPARLERMLADYRDEPLFRAAFLEHWNRFDQYDRGALKYVEALLRMGWPASPATDVGGGKLPPPSTPSAEETLPVGNISERGWWQRARDWFTGGRR